MSVQGTAEDTDNTWVTDEFNLLLESTTRAEIIAHLRPSHDKTALLSAEDCHVNMFDVTDVLDNGEACLNNISQNSTQLINPEM